MSRGNAGLEGLEKLVSERRQRRGLEACGIPGAQRLSALCNRGAALELMRCRGGGRLDESGGGEKIKDLQSWRGGGGAVAGP